MITTITDAAAVRTTEITGTERETMGMVMEIIMGMKEGTKITVMRGTNRTAITRMVISKVVPSSGEED